MTTNKTVRFIKGYPKFAYLMSNNAVCFMMHMADIEFLRKCNYTTNWSKKQYASRMNLNIREFNRCACELVELGLLDVTKSANGRYTAYWINQMAYRKLLKVCAATINYKRIKSFLKEIKAKGRLIQDVSDYEISALKEFPNEYYSEAPYVKVYPGFSCLLTPDEVCLLMHISEIEHLVKYHNTSYSFQIRQEWLDKTDMAEDVFDEAVKKMKQLSLIWETPKDDAQIIYKHSIRGYRNLIDVCGATFNYNALKDYFDWLIIKRKRSLCSVKEEDLKKLEEYGRHYGRMSFPFHDLPDE